MFMQAENNKRIIQQYFEDLNSKPKTKDLIDQYISDEDMELKEHIQVFEAAFPGYKLEPKETIVEEDKVSVSFNFIGTQKGDFNGIPASNKTVNIPGFISYHVKDGKIVSHDMVVDTMSLMQQLGAIPEAAN